MRRETISFYEFYARIYGERWESLYQSLQKDSRSIEFNNFLLGSYFLDDASVLVAQYLRAKPEHRILDCCAAPGGKSIVIISELIRQLALLPSVHAKNEPQSLNDSRLKEKPVSELDITLNDRSSKRRARLHKVISSLVPEQYRYCIRITGHDASIWGKIEPESYDRVLVDIPCSAERHLLAKTDMFQTWSPSRGKRLAQQGYAMLLSMLSVLRPGGVLVYATCSLNPAENADTIARVLEKLEKRGEMRFELDLEQPGVDWVEQGDLGFSVLPDSADGRGPAFFSRLRRKMYHQ